MSQMPLWRKIGYAAGGLGFDLSFNVTSFYQIFFLTSVALIQPVEAGVLAGLPVVLLAPLRPIAGIFSDRMHSRLGRRLFIFFCGPLSGLLLWLKFSAPSGLEVAALIAYWWVVQLVSNANGSILGVTYDALGAELSSSSAERLQIVGMRQSLGIIGALIGSSIPLILVRIFGGGSVGFAAMGLVFGCLVALSFVAVGFAAPRRAASPVRQQSFRREMVSTLRLRPFWLQLGIAFLAQMSVVVTNTTLVFYLSYTLGIGSLLPLVILCVTVVALLSIPGLTWMSRRWDTRWTFIFSIVVYATVLLSLRFMPEGNTLWFWLLVPLAGLGVGALNIFPKSMITDVAAYDRAREGRSRAGSIMGLWSLGGTAGEALGSGLIGLLLAFVGYRAGMEATTGFKEGLRLIMGVVPGTLLLLTVPLIMFSLSRAEMMHLESTSRYQT